MTLNLKIPDDAAKHTIFMEVEEELTRLGFTIVDQDDARPWGGFFVIDEAQAPRFIETFFPNHNPTEFALFSRLSPKILMVAPGKRLSWQYHHRRSELWRVVAGEAGVVVSKTDEQGPVRKLTEGDEVELEQGERHRLVGTYQWGVVAEIWKHTDPEKPSDEEDIVRVEDDFGR